MYDIFIKRILWGEIMDNKVQIENAKTYHYMILGYETFPKILRTLAGELNFYRISRQSDIDGKEIMYDIPNNALTDAGIVLSKQYKNGRVMFKVQKLSFLPEEMRLPSKKFVLQELGGDAEPKDFSLEISSAIENSFSTPFTIDLDAIVREVVPKIEITIKSESYLIIGGTGFRGQLFYERVVYKDVATKKKVEKEGVVLKLPNDETAEKDNERILDIIDRKVKGLGLYNMSRFELAQKALYTVEEEEELFDEDATDEEEEN